MKPMRPEESSMLGNLLDSAPTGSYSAPEPSSERLSPLSAPSSGNSESQNPGSLPTNEAEEADRDLALFLIADHLEQYIQNNHSDWSKEEVFREFAATICVPQIRELLLVTEQVCSQMEQEHPDWPVHHWYDKQEQEGKQV